MAEKSRSDPSVTGVSARSTGMPLPRAGVFAITIHGPPTTRVDRPRQKLRAAADNQRSPNQDGTLVAVATAFIEVGEEH